MAYIRGNQGYVMISGKQTDNLTKATPTFTGTIASGEDLKLVKPQKQVLTDRIRYSNSPSIVQIGRSHVEGTLNFDCMPDEALGICLAMVAGANNTVSGNVSTGYTHTYNFWSACSEMSSVGVTFQKLVGSCSSTMLADYIGCFVNNFEMTIPEDGIVTFSENIMGVKNTFAGSSLSSPSYTTKSPFEGWMAKLSVGSVIGSVSAVSMKSCKISINNNLQMVVDHNASNQYPTTFIPSTRVVNLEFEISQEDNLTFYNYFLNDTENAVQIELTHPQLAGSASGVYSIVFKFPRVTWLGDEPTINSADIIAGSYKMHVLKDSVTGYDVQAVVVNSQSGTYSV